MQLSGKFNNRLTGVVLLSFFVVLSLMPQLHAREPEEYGNNARRSLMEADQDRRSPRYESPSKRSSIGLSEAIAKARQIQPGEVLGVRRSTDSRNRPIYVVKVLTPSGVVKKVRVNAGE